MANSIQNIRERNKNIAFLGSMFAVVLFLTFLPAIFTVNLALSLIPIAITAQVKNWKMGLIMGGMFGLASMFYAFTLSASILKFAFMNPIISVIPRIITGGVSGLVYQLMRKWTSKLKNDKSIVLSSTIATIATVLTNTIFVLGFMLLFYNNRALNSEVVLNFKFVASIVLATNTLLEIIVIPIVTPPLVLAMSKAMRKVVARVSEEV